MSAQSQGALGIAELALHSTGGVTPLNAAGNGVTDDTATITAAVSKAASAGRGVVAFSAAQSYLIKRNPAGQISTGIAALSGVSLIGNGCLLLGGQDNALIYGKGTEVAKVAVTADIAAGSTVVPVADGTKFAAGDDVIWRLGDVPYDTPETQNFGWARVVSVSGNNVTLDRPINTAFTLSGAVNNLHLIKLAPLTNFKVDGFRFAAAAGSTVEAGLYLTYARDVVIQQIDGTACGAGIVVLQYCQDVTLRDVSGYSSRATQASFGRGISLAECTGISIENLRTRDFDGAAIECEDATRAYARNVHDINTYQYTGANSRRSILSAQGKAELVVENLAVSGFGGFITSTVSNGQSVYNGRVKVHNARYSLDTEAYQIPLPCQDLTGRLVYSVAGNEERYDCEDAYWWERIYFLKDGESITTFGQPGILCDLRIFLSAAIVPATDLLNLYIGRQTNNGTNYLAQLSAGNETSIPVFAGAVGNPQWSLRANRFQALISGAASGLTGTGKFVRVRALLLQDRNTSSVALADADVLNKAGLYFIEGAATWSPGAIAAGATASTTVTVTGAALGDFVDSVSFSTALNGVVIDMAEVTSANTVTVTFRNPTAGSLTPASSTLRVRVSKPRIGA